MKKSSVALLAATGLLGAALVPVTQAWAQAPAAGLQARNSSLPEWLRRTDISVEGMDRSNPTWSVETVQPLYQTPATLSDTVFFQGRWGRRNSDNTINLGLGYRRLLDDKSWLLGVNAFYDMTTKYDHRRYGLGAEAIGRYITLRANYYDASNDEKVVSINNGITVTEKALDGYDYELDAPIPFLPWLRLSASSYRWKSVTSGLANVRGDKLSLKANLNRYVSLELGRQDDNYRPADSFVMLTFNLMGAPGNGVPSSLFDGVRTTGAFQPRDLTRHTLDKVRRQNEIVVERKSSGGAGISIGRRN